MKYIEKAKYPCGFEYTIEFNGSIFGMIDVTWDIEKMTCPIHGKDCKEV